VTVHSIVLVHFIVVEGDSVRPLCGEWARSPSWTKNPDVVTCPHCRALLARLAGEIGARPLTRGISRGWA
jgi:hypothetical protein